MSPNISLLRRCHAHALSEYQGHLLAGDQLRTRLPEEARLQDMLANSKLSYACGMETAAMCLSFMDLEAELRGNREALTADITANFDRACDELRQGAADRARETATEDRLLAGGAA